MNRHGVSGPSGRVQYPWPTVMGRHFSLPLALCLPSLLLAAPATPGSPEAERLVAGARALREARDYDKAAVLLKEAVRLAPTEEHLVLLGETLAWARRFGEAEKAFRKTLARFSGSHDALLGLGRLRLWEGRLADAMRLFSLLLARSAEDVEAREAKATAEYWAGDTRGAARDFRLVLKSHPGREPSRRSLAEIEDASAPRFDFSASYGSDDQPYRVGQVRVEGSFFSDPLTRWDGAVGTYSLRAPVSDVTKEAPWALARLEAGLPPMRLTITPWIGALRFPDGRTQGLGGVALRHALSKSSSVTVAVEKKELLATSTSLASHASVTTFGATWNLETASGWLAAAGAQGASYFDGNHGSSFHVWALAPVISSPLIVRAGLASSYRDTAEDRFRVDHVESEILAPGSFAYRIIGSYDPYWTPHDLVELRAALSLRFAPSPALTLDAHAEGGWAHDRAPGFGPSSGPTTSPEALFSFFYPRTFHPWRFSASATASLPAGLKLVVGYLHDSTVFYNADSVHASLGGRF